MASWRCKGGDNEHCSRGQSPPYTGPQSGDLLYIRLTPFAKVIIPSTTPVCVPIRPMPCRCPEITRSLLLTGADLLCHVLRVITSPSIYRDLDHTLDLGTGSILPEKNIMLPTVGPCADT